MNSTLDVTIACFGPDGGEKIAAMGLPRLSGVRYIVSWQMGGDWHWPEEVASREDITMLRLDGVGLSANRNNALRHATADVVLIADDDLRYLPGGLEAVIEVMTSHPQLDFATFREALNIGNKYYPPQECDLTELPKGYHVTSFELALRRKSVADKGFMFDEELGINAPYLQSAEESLFVLEMLRNGLRGRFFPIEIVRHDGPTTGQRPHTPGVTRGEGAYIRAAYPHTAPLRLMLKGWRLWRAGHAQLLPAWMHLWQGWFYWGRLKRQRKA